MTSAPLYRWPTAAKFGRVVPKAKFYEHSPIPVPVRDRFVAEVKRITWAYKLADETLHLSRSEAVPEIQVFVIDAKVSDVSDAVLTAIDRAISFPIIFEINRNIAAQAQTRMVAAHKQLGSAAPRLSGYFSTEWQPAGASRTPLPPALDLPGLYAGLLQSILPIAVRPGDGLSEATGRMDQARKLEREIANLEKRLRAEPQLNRKIELRRLLRDRTAVLAALTDTATQKTEEAQWTSSGCTPAT